METTTFRYMFKSTPRDKTMYPELWDRHGQTVVVLRRWNEPDDEDAPMAEVLFPDDYVHAVFAAEIE